MSETEQEAEPASRGKGLASLHGSQGTMGGMGQISLKVHAIFFLIFKAKKWFI